MKFEVNEVLAYFTQAINSNVKALENISQMDFESVCKALQVMQQAECIVFCAVGKSYLIAKKTAALLMSLGFRSYTLHATECVHGDLGFIKPKDVLIFISNSGNSCELIDVVRYCNRFNIDSIGITSNPNSFLGKNTKINLIMPPNGELDPNIPAPTLSSTITLVLCDILAMCLMKNKNFQQSEYALYHPAGSIGNTVRPITEMLQNFASDQIITPNTSRENIVNLVNTFNFAIVIDNNGKFINIHTHKTLLNNNIQPQDKLFVSDCRNLDIAKSLFAEHKNMSRLVVCDEHIRPIGFIARI